MIRSRSSSRSIRSAPIAQRSLQNPRNPLRLSAWRLTRAVLPSVGHFQQEVQDDRQGSSTGSWSRSRPLRSAARHRPKAPSRARTAGIVFQRGAPYDGGQSSLFLVNANGTGLVQLTRGYQHDAQPSWSPDGSLIAFESTRHSDTDVYVIRPDGSSLKELTFSRGFDGDPAWNDDGTRIAFETSRNGKLDIYSINSDGTGETRLTTSAADDADPAWSPDGTRIAFMSDRSGRRQVWVMNADGTGQTQLTNAANIGGENPSWSPNGRTIVFDSDRDAAGNLDIWSMNADGTDQRRLTNSPALDALPSYSPDGKLDRLRQRPDGQGQPRVLPDDRERWFAAPAARKPALGHVAGLGPEPRPCRLHDHRHDQP